MTEYAILVGLVAILLIAAVRRFAGAVSGAFEAAAARVESDVGDAIREPTFAPAPPDLRAGARMRRLPRGEIPPAGPAAGQGAR